MQKRTVAWLLPICLLWLLCLKVNAGSQEIRIGIIDTGISTVAIDSKSVTQGENYILPQDGTEDLVGHGTAIAAILVGSEAAGIQGVCPEAVLIPLVYSTKNAQGNLVRGNTAVVAQALYDAVDRYRCRIVNISSATLTDSDTLRQAVAYAEQQGVLVVASVGNDGSDDLYYPAAYESVLGVGAATPDLTVASFSQRNRTVDILAPGTKLRIATIRGKTMAGSGTSFATAYATGTAAKLLKQTPELTPWQLRQILCGSATDIAAVGRDDASGWGVLNGDLALKWAAQGVGVEKIGTTQWCVASMGKAADAGRLGEVCQSMFFSDVLVTRAMLCTALTCQVGQATAPFLRDRENIAEKTQ